MTQQSFKCFCLRGYPVMQSSRKRATMISSSEEVLRNNKKNIFYLRQWPLELGSETLLALTTSS